VEKLVTESVDESVVLRVMPCDARGVLLQRLAPGFVALCHAQQGFELGLICSEGRRLWFVQDRVKRLIKGTTVRTVLQKRRTSHGASYPKIRVGLGDEMVNTGAPLPSGVRSGAGVEGRAAQAVQPLGSGDSMSTAATDFKPRPEVTVMVKKRRHFTLPAVPVPQARASVDAG